MKRRQKKIPVHNLICTVISDRILIVARKKKSKYRGHRDNNYISERSTLMSPLFFRDKIKNVRDDKRFYRPDFLTGAILVDGRPAEFTLSERSRKGKKIPFKTTIIGFADEKRVKVCIRRRKRREELFRRNLAGKGKRVSRRRIYNEDSYIKC